MVFYYMYYISLIIVYNIINHVRKLQIMQDITHLIILFLILLYKKIKIFIFDINHDALKNIGIKI